MMHPQLSLLLAQDRAADNRRAAAAARQRREVRPHRSARVRERAGWALVAAGLHLAVSAKQPLAP